MLDAIRSLQAGPVEAQPEEDDWRARLRAAALKVSQATGGMMLTDKREDTFIKAVDVFKQLKAVEGTRAHTSNMNTRTSIRTWQLTLSVGLRRATTKNVSGPGDDDTQAKLRQAALLVGKATEHLVVSNANDQQYIRPVDVRFPSSPPFFSFGLLNGRCCVACADFQGSAGGEQRPGGARPAAGKALQCRPRRCPQHGAAGKHRLSCYQTASSGDHITPTLT